MITGANDAAWVEELRLGSEAAFNFLYAKYSKKVYNTSRKMNLSHEDAEGIVQETFIKIWNNRVRLDPALSFNAYLLSILKSLVVRFLQQKARKAVHSTEWFKKTEPFQNPTEDDLFYAEMLEASLSEVNKLPPRQKEVFLLKRIELFSLDEIADKLKISKKTVKNQLVEANKFLKTRIKDIDILALLLIWIS